MKRVLLAVVCTIAGLIALLSFKSHAPGAGAAGPLPSAALPGATTIPPAAKQRPAPTANPPQRSASNGTRTVAGEPVQTPYGVVQIQLVASGTKITNVSYLQLTADDGHSRQINGYAAPVLLRETLAAQSANIDTVSGATYTSEGYIQSLQSALDRAGIR